MSLREALKNNQSIVAIVAVIVLVGCGVWIMRGRGTAGMPDRVYFYDLSDGQLFPADRTAQPPIDAPKGGPGKGVKASVFSCGECSAAELKVAYLTQLTPEAQAAAKSAPSNSDGVSARDLMATNQAIDNGTMVATPAAVGADVKWVRASSGEGNAIVARAASQLCGEAQPKPCFP